MQKTGPTLRVAAIELFVEVRSSRAQEPPGDAEAILRALRADPGARREAALAAIRAARESRPDVILCPGWTFVGRAPADRTLAAAAGPARLVYEVVEARDAGPPKDPKASAAGPRWFPWRSFVLEGGTRRELAPQVVSLSADLGDAARAQGLADALRGDRAVGEATLLVCGEVNVVRRRPRNGTVGHVWEPRVAEAGLPASALEGRVVLNPAHGPNGSYVRNKWRAGPWRAIVCTANTLDRSRLGRSAAAPPAVAVVDGGDVAGQETALEGGSRVVVFEV